MSGHVIISIWRMWLFSPSQINDVDWRFWDSQHSVSYSAQKKYHEKSHSNKVSLLVLRSSEVAYFAQTYLSPLYLVYCLSTLREYNPTCLRLHADHSIYRCGYIIWSLFNLQIYLNTTSKISYHDIKHTLFRAMSRFSHPRHYYDNVNYFCLLL